MLTKQVSELAGVTVAVDGMKVEVPDCSRELADTHAVVMAYEAARTLATKAEYPESLSGHGHPDRVGRLLGVADVVEEAVR
ncbi:hypothetical protein SAMN04487981_11620 [Streptomyces sp. cf386]|uniref:hypothetical protein n=1 Tax=Streptomyces sp. cf386 TaxID=1761904 RepID=UPI00088642FC|nr:hypothetical protein [Streptomyces sp. cf386]SDP04826.1 hypothetical protein SAMN04487981_11620 [Streptomyces sp. cf386]